MHNPPYPSATLRGLFRDLGEKMKNYRNALFLLVAILSGCGGGGTTTPIQQDTTAPITTVLPVVLTASDTAVRFYVAINENGTGYYIVQPYPGTAPTLAQMQAASYFAMSANVERYQNVTGLTANTQYKIYFVAKDDAGNVQPTVQSVIFMTDRFVTQGGLYWMPISFFLNWTDADAYCRAFRGAIGWRLPTSQELLALYAENIVSPSILQGSGWELGETWSSDPSMAGYHATVTMSHGTQLGAPDNADKLVSCVR